jgi:hypothetical protein
MPYLKRTGVLLVSLAAFGLLPVLHDRAANIGAAWRSVDEREPAALPKAENSAVATAFKSFPASNRQMLPLPGPSSTSPAPALTVRLPRG